MKIRKAQIGAIILAGCLLLLTSVVLFVYNSYLKNHLIQQTVSTLDEVKLQQMYNFDSKLTAQKETMKGFAYLIANLPKDKPTLVKHLTELVKNTDFEYMTFAYPDGIAFNNEGIDMDVSDRSYLGKALAGETVISDPVMSKVRNAKIIVVATPVVADGVTVGVLTGSYKSENLDKHFLPSFSGYGYAYITTNSGDVVAKTTNTYRLLDKDNIFEFWKGAIFYQNDSIETIKHNLHNNKGGSAWYNFKGQKRYMQYRTIEVNDWNIFSVVPEQAIMKNTTYILTASTIMTIAIALVFLIMALILYTYQKRYNKKLSDIAFVDELTKAPTLAKFKMEAQRLLEENPDTQYILVKCDIDRFKLINQTLGYAQGDRILCCVADAFRENLQDHNETFGRVNTDEYIVLHKVVSQDHLVKLSDNFHSLFRKHIGEDFEYEIKFPTGHYMIPKGDRDISSAIERANVAHRRAKELGVELVVYNEELIEEALRRKDIENRMNLALANGEFKVYLQPKYRLMDERLDGAEALVRWRASDVDVVYPNSFIPIFEDNGFIVKLDMYMFESVCKLIKGWIDEGVTPVVVSVNFSRLHLENDEFVKQLCSIADRCGAPRNYLELELTETTIFDNEEVLQLVVEQLHSAGFTLSMDDFGTGYSSLGLLKNLAVDAIKLDRSFFVSANGNKRAKTVLTHVIDMAKDLEAHTVAEGVEIKEQIDILKQLDCDMVQGYYYSRPLPVSDFYEKLIAERASS